MSKRKDRLAVRLGRRDWRQRFELRLREEFLRVPFQLQQLNGPSTTWDQSSAPSPTMQTCVVLSRPYLFSFEILHALQCRSPGRLALLLQHLPQLADSALRLFQQAHNRGIQKTVRRGRLQASVADVPRSLHGGAPRFRSWIVAAPSPVLQPARQHPWPPASSAETHKALSNSCSIKRPSNERQALILVDARSIGVASRPTAGLRGRCGRAPGCLPAPGALPPAASGTLQSMTMWRKNNVCDRLVCVMGNLQGIIAVRAPASCWAWNTLSSSRLLVSIRPRSAKWASSRACSTSSESFVRSSWSSASSFAACSRLCSAATSSR